MRRVGLGQHAVRARAALRAHRRHEHEAFDTRAAASGDELGRGGVNDPIVDGWINARAYVGDAGEMHDALDAVEQRRPIERLHIVRDGDDLDAAGERRRSRVARRGADGNPRSCQRPHQGIGRRIPTHR